MPLTDNQIIEATAPIADGTDTRPTLVTDLGQQLIIQLLSGCFAALRIIIQNTTTAP